MPEDQQGEALPSGQLLLLDMPEAHEGRELLKIDEDRDRYPLSTIERDQERLQSIIHLLAADAPLRYICRAHRVGWHTLESIRAKQGTKIAAVKRTIAQRMSTFVQLGIEQLLDDLAAGNLDSDKLGVTLGIVVDKMQLLTGEATTITATTNAPRVTAETLRERLANMKPAVPTGSDGENISQTGAAGALVELPPAGSDSASAENTRN